MNAKQCLARCRIGTLLGVLWGVPLVVAQESADAADPNASVPATVYRSAFEGTGPTRRDAGAPLPWKRLFKPDGSFVPEEELSPGMTSEGSMAPTGSESMAKSMPQSMSSLSPGASDARGTVKGVDKAQGKVKLKHGPIDKFDMPGMTMMFRVEDPSLLERVQEGEEVGFTVDKQGNAFVVTGFQSLQADMSQDIGQPATTMQGGSDARGMVKAIDKAQGKVKLQHGPIDKLGMPGMTMMFRVDDPSLLDTVREGEEVGFTIERQGSAFVVTGFQP